MPMEPPPSRYRVVERGGRLVVIDSAVGGAPLTARELLSRDGAAPPYPRDPEGGDSQRGDPEPEAASSLTLDSRFRENTALEIGAPRRPASNPPGAAQSVAETVTGNTRDDQGRLLLTTARWYDAKGPRTLALSEAGERQLGAVVIALTVAAIIAVVLAVMGETIGWVIVVAAIIALSRAKPIATAWLDRQVVT